jgi:hypothetical protein
LEGAVNQLAFALHRSVRHRKAVECTEKADSIEPKWSDRAYAFLCQFASQRDGEFLGEEVIYASRDAVPAAHDKRAWGSIFVKAVRRGVLKQAGASRATRNCSLKPTYIRGMT